jgi:dihydroorotase
LQTYVQVFDEENALDCFESFASLNGPRFYGLKPNSGTMVLKRQPGRAVPSITVDRDEVVVFRGGEDLAWSIGEVRP